MAELETTNHDFDVSVLIKLFNKLWYILLFIALPPQSHIIYYRSSVNWRIDPL